MKDFGRNRARAPDRAPEVGDWREPTLRGMFKVGAVVAPLASVLAIFLRERRGLDTVVIGAAGLVMPVLFFARRVPAGARAGLAIAALLGAGTFMLLRGGLAPGAALLFVVAGVFGAVSFGRAGGYLVIGVGALTIVGVGWLVTSGLVPFPPADFDPHKFRNWYRVGVIFALIASLLTSAVSFVIRRVEASARDLRVAYERLGQLHLRLESTKEDERRFLAHELHDEFGQSLTALKLQLAARDADSSGRVGTSHAESFAVIDDLIARVRRMSGDLRPPLLDEIGLVPALRAFLETQAALSGVAMTLDTKEPAAEAGAPTLGPDLEITCFRIVQEAITNALRHAGARDLRVHLERGVDRVALRISDDGRGFDVGVRLEGAAAAGHLGVVGMRERVRVHGGGFRLRSQPGAGTTIEVELPVNPAVGRGGLVAVPS
ncbi:MAG: sensor histidine kinase [Myxococcales bacterium]|nr:sensor histidine kinase [Myxococcales bacterium]